MSSVLVGMFDSASQAQAARTQLMQAGFSAVSITPDTHSTSPILASDGTTTNVPHHQGGILGFLENLFGSDNDRDDERAGYKDTYNEAFKRGSYGVSVTTATEDELDRAQDILNAAGAIDIDERSEEWRKEGWTGGMARPALGAAAAGSTQKLQEVEEELRVGKRAVSRGGVRVFTRLTEVPVQESVTLREERADVTRRVVDRPASEADFAAFKEGSIEVRNTAEEAVISKTARVTGEVEVGQTVTEREEVINDTVRKTTVDVEQLDGTLPAAGTTPPVRRS